MTKLSCGNVSNIAEMSSITCGLRSIIDFNLSSVIAFTSALFIFSIFTVRSFEAKFLSK